MPNKSLSIYNHEPFIVEEGDQLVVEIAKSHLACVVTRGHKPTIVASELFTFEENEGDNFNELFEILRQQSNLLSINSSPLYVHINHEYCIPVPIFKFNKEIAADYLNVVFGEDDFSRIHFEHLPIDPGIMNVYRVKEDCYQSLTSFYQRISFHHSYSNIIRRISKVTSNLPDQHITIQFYHTFIILLVMKEGNLYLIQSIQYEKPEDVLYHLLNIARQLELYSPALTINVSGMIDLDFKLYRELITYFNTVLVENVEPSNLLLQMGEHPLHYFTPFFNLAL